MSLLESVRLGSQTPSVELLPPDSAGSAGAEAVELAALAGLELDPWQAYCLEHGLAERADGMWAAFLNVIVVSRQNGKGSILEARELAGLYLLNERLILHSAHEFKTCYEHFLRIIALIENTPDLDRRVQKIRRGVGEQAVELKNGSRLRFIARSGGSGRGMSAPCVVLDEAMFLTEAMLGAIMPTLSAQANPQLWLTSSAPLSTSGPLHRLRRQALSGQADRLFYAEWGNEPGVDQDDVEAIARANPALGRRIFLDFVQAERESMSPEEFARERLGVPEAEPVEGAVGVIDLDAWEACQTATSLVASDRAEALAVSADRRLGWFAVAGRRADGRLHVESVPVAMREVVERAVERWGARGVPLRSRQRWPEIVERGVEMVEVSSKDYAAGVNMLIAAVEGRQLAHIGQRSLDAAVKVAQLSGSGVWVGSPEVDVAPLEAATLALSGVPDLSDDDDWNPESYSW